MRRTVLSRPYLATWLTGYLFLWGGMLIEYPAWLFVVNLVAVVACSLMAIPWVLLSLAGIATLAKDLLHASRRPKQRSRHKRHRRRRAPSPSDIELPDLSAGGHRASDDGVDHARARIAGHILRSYIMQPHVHTSMLKYQPSSAMEDAYIQVREHVTTEKTPQFYQDLCLASISAYCVEQKLGYIPGESTRFMITQAKQACRQFAISQGECRDEVIEECYRALSAQAEHLTDAMLPDLKALAATLREPVSAHPFVLYEADILRWHQAMGEQCPQQLQERIAA